MEIYRYSHERGRGFKMRNIVIIGAGDLSKELVWLIEDINRLFPKYLILGFLDDDQYKIGGEFYGYKVLGTINQLEDIAERTATSAVIAIQDGSIRKRIVSEHLEFKNWESIVHPTAVVASTSLIGRGTIIFPQVTISVDSKIGEFNLFYIHSTICNDCTIGDYVSIMSGVSVSEHTEIGDECFLAAGSTVYPHKKLGRKVEVGVEATVTRDYEDETIVSESHRGFSLFK